MGVLDDYLQGLANKQSSNQFQASVNTGEPLASANLAGFPKPSQFQASVGATSAGDIYAKTYPEESLEKYISQPKQPNQQRALTYNQQMPGGDFGINQLLNTGKAVYNTAKLGYNIANKLAPEAVKSLGESAIAELGVQQIENAAFDVAADALPQTAINAIDTAGSALGSVVGGVATAMPYYALAKAGGTLINAITANNPQFKETPFGKLGESLEEPLAVEAFIAKDLAKYGIGNDKFNEYILSEANPLEVGGWLTDTTDKFLNTFTGNLYTPLNELKNELGDVGNVAALIMTGGLSGLVDSICIIVTACTNPYSYEVEVAREYRDKFLTQDQLRGYYMLAEKIVPAIKENAKIKRFVKRHLVDNLIEYGEYALGKTTFKPSLKSKIISKSFLSLIKLIGKTRKSYTRKNGEVY
jgi:hypothetical protein